MVSLLCVIQTTKGADGGDNGSVFDELTGELFHFSGSFHLPVEPLSSYRLLVLSIGSNNSGLNLVTLYQKTYMLIMFYLHFHSIDSSSDFLKLDSPQSQALKGLAFDASDNPDSGKIQAGSWKAIQSGVFN